MNKQIAAIWLIMAAMITSGCQTLGSLEAPEVSVTGIALNSISLFEQEWGLTLRARNPNDRELTLKSLDYEIFINGEKFARGLTGESVTLPAMGDAQVTTTITTSLLRDAAVSAGGNACKSRGSTSAPLDPELRRSWSTPLGFVCLSRGTTTTTTTTTTTFCLIG